MGLRFRKSIKVAPGVKLNINKKSASVTVGAKGAHVTKSTNGRTTTSAGIPGTGVSYVETTGEASGRHSRGQGQRNETDGRGRRPKKKNWLKRILIAAGVIFGLLILLAWIGGGFDNSTTQRQSEADTTANTEPQTEKAAQVQTERETEKQTQPQTEAKAASKYVRYVSADVNVRTAPSTDAEVITQLEAWSEIQFVAVDNGWAQIDYEGQTAYVSAEYVEQFDARKVTVYISSGGSKYHSRTGCGGMEDPQKVTLYEAVNSGYEPCKICTPPSY